MMVKVGIGKADITPVDASMPMGGFTVRNNQSATGVLSPLFVRALMIESGGGLALLLSYELLGVGPELEAIVFQSLERLLGGCFDGENCVLVSTHTHSAPQVMNFAGQASLDESYLNFVGEQSSLAVKNALANCRGGDLYLAEMDVPGLTYNRRSVLADGRVSIKLDPGFPVVERGPLDTKFSLLLWKDSSEENIAAIAHFPVHGVSTLTQELTGDIPGAISAGFETRLGVPCLFLQGATGDINPIITRTDGREKLSAWVETFFSTVENIEVDLKPVQVEQISVVSSGLPLAYARLPDQSFLEKRIDQWTRVESGDFTSDAVQEIIPAIRELTGRNPGDSIDADLAKETAALLTECDQFTLDQLQSGQSFAPPQLGVACWRLGKVIFVFIAAEVFAVTGARIRALSNGSTVLPVGFASGLLGYLPDDDAMKKGGYETEYSWKMYLHPAPFATGSESQLIEDVKRKIKNCNHPVIARRVLYDEAI